MYLDSFLQWILGSILLFHVFMFSIMLSDLVTISFLVRKRICPAVHALKHFERNGVFFPCGITILFVF